MLVQDYHLDEVLHKEQKLASEELFAFFKIWNSSQLNQGNVCTWASHWEQKWQTLSREVSAAFIQLRFMPIA